MPSHEDPKSVSRQQDRSWAAQWAAVPEQWRRPVYQIDAAPADAVFLRNRYYLRENGGRAEHDFTPPGVPPRFAEEIAWWVWCCHREGLRKIEPSLLRWAGQALGAAATEYRTRHRRAPVSITDLDAAAIVRAAVLAFEKRNSRLPSAGARRNITHLVEHLHLYLSVRCTDTPWWAHDIWDLQADPRIPQREHEPRHDLTLNLAAITLVWLREGVRFWLRTCLDAELLRWSSAVERCRDTARHLGPFLASRSANDPVLTENPAQLRLIFTEFTEYLKSPAAGAKPDKPLSKAAVDATQSQTQVFYTFMVDHGPEAAAATGEPRWAQLSAAHTRLWGPAFRTRRAHRTRELTWYSTAELQRMLAYLDVLAADRTALVGLTHPDGSVSLVKGLGDPQAARIWLLQALTGRRASEILMLDHNPLQPIPGVGPPAETEDPDAFVAKLRYQQTKVDGVEPTILVEQAVVNVIAEQQNWLATTFPRLTPKYLFIGIKSNLNGQRPRPYATYSQSLTKLDDLHGLTDGAGNPLRFSQTHRLRHTRATELHLRGIASDASFGGQRERCGSGDLGICRSPRSRSDSRLTRPVSCVDARRPAAQMHLVQR